VLSWWTPGIIATPLIIFIRPLREALPHEVSGGQTPFYAAVAGVAGALLGLLVAAITFLAGLPGDRPLLKRLKGLDSQEPGQGRPLGPEPGTASPPRVPSLLEKTLSLFSRATESLGLLTILALLGLIIDHQPATHLPANRLGAGAYWVWPVALAGVPAVVRVRRCLRVLAEIAGLTAQPQGPQDHEP
jgi:hypothetical protein